MRLATGGRLRALLKLAVGAAFASGAVLAASATAAPDTRSAVSVATHHSQAGPAWVATHARTAHSGARGASQATSTATPWSPSQISKPRAGGRTPGFERTAHRGVSAPALGGLLRLSTPRAGVPAPSLLAPRRTTLQIVELHPVRAGAMLVPNSPPDAQPDYLTMSGGGGPGSVDVLANDTDPDGDPLSVAFWSDGAGGSVQCADTCEYQPGIGFYGEDSFGYTVSDGNGGLTSSTVYVTVVDDAPVFTSSSTQTVEPGATPTAVTATDPNGDAVTYSDSGGLPSGITLAPDGTFSGLASMAGDYTTTITADDGYGQTSTQSLTITVPNRAPVVAATQSQTLANHQGLTSLSATDPNGDSLSFSLQSGTLPAGISLASDGSFTGTATTPGGTSAVIAITDGVLTSTTTLDVTVLDTAPVANADAFSVPGGGMASLDVLANDTDADGDTLQIVSANGVAHGAFDCSSKTECFYLPNAGYYGTDGFDYTISDGRGQTSSAHVTVTVMNTAPVFTSASSQVVQPGSTPAAVTANDANGDTVTFTADSGLPGGVTLQSDGSFTGTVSTAGSYTATITASDGYGGTSTQSLTITVPNKAPVVAASQSQTVANHHALTALTATDPNGDSLTYSLLSGSLPSGISLLSTGAFSGTTTTPGVTSAVIQVSDGSLSSNTTLNVTVLNTAPVATDDTFTVQGGLNSTLAVLANDTDGDGDTLTVTSATAAAHGTVTCSAGTSCSYLPAAGYYGPDGFDYTVSDGRGGTATAHVTLTVANTAPTFTSGASQTVEPGATPTAVTATDLNGDTVTFSAGTGLPSGVTLQSDGGFLGTASTAGAFTATITATDGHGGITTQALTITVPNRAPVVAATQSQTVANHQPLASLSASDPNGDALSFSVLSGALPAGITLGSDGSFSGMTTTPGSSSAVIQVSDGALTSNTTVNVTVLNTTPVATADSYTVTGGHSSTLTVLSNDTDADGDSLAIVSATAPSHGSINCSAGTSCSYAPAARAHGADSFSYTVNDGRGGTSTATVSLTIANTAPVLAGPLTQTLATGQTPTAVSGSDADLDTLTYGVSGTLPPGLTFGTDGIFHGTIAASAGHHSYPLTVSVDDGWGGSASTGLTLTVTNDAPSASSDTLATWKNIAASVNVLSNDTDSNGDTLSIVGAGPAAHGTVTCSAPSCDYTPAAGYVGPDSFSYTVDDGFGGQSTATVGVTVSGRAPVAVADTASTFVKVPVTVAVTSNDTDADLGDVLTVTGHGSPSHGAVACDASSCTYTPSVTYAGADSFTYTISDPDGFTSSATVSVTVVDRTPTPAADSFSVQGGMSTVLDVLANDTDPDGDTLTVTSATAPGHGAVTCAVGTSCRYTPTSGYYGSDSFSYTVTDAYGKTASVSVSLTVLNTAPAFAGPSAQTVATGARPTAVLATDLNSDPLTYSITGTLPAGLGYQTSGSFTGAIASSAGHQSYSLTVTADDGHGGSAATPLTITVPNDAPVAAADAASTPKNIAVDVPVTTNDVDANGDTVTVQGSSSAGHGTVSCTATDCTYTPNAAYVGPDSFSYTVSDGFGGADSATVTLTVYDRAPTPAADTATTTEAVPVDVDVLTNDTDPDGDVLTVQGATNGAHGPVTCTSTSCRYSPVFGFVGTDTFTYTAVDVDGLTATATVTVTVTNQAPVAVDDMTTTTEGVLVSLDPRSNDSDPDHDPIAVTGHGNATHGTVTCTATSCSYTPTFGYIGTDSFTYTITDTHAGTATATVAVTVTNQTPVAVDDVATTTEGVLVSLDPRSNDSDPDHDAITVSDHSDPSHGVVSCTATSCSYTPTFGYIGTDSFTYTITDTHTATATATVTVTVTNQTPVAVDDVATTTEGVLVSLDPRANDSDPDHDAITVTGHGSATHGTVTCTGTSCSYAPTFGYIGADSFTYTITDTHAASATAKVTVTVTNQAPVAVDDTASTFVRQPITVSVLSNDSDPDGDALSVTGHGNAAHGSVTCTVVDCTYRPTSSYAGADSFTYTMTDTHGAMKTGTVAVSVIDRAPTAVNDAVDTPSAGPVSVAVLVNDTDPDSDALAVVAHTAAAHGRLTCTSTTCTYTPGSGYVGSDSFRYTARDPYGLSSVATVSINVTDRAPVARDDNPPTTGKNTPITVPVLGNDDDPDLDPISVVSVGLPGHGTATCDASSCTYVPASGFAGNDSFTYTISDGRGGTASATVFVTVGNRAPTFTAVPSNDTQNGAVGVALAPLQATDPDGDALSFTVTSGSLPPGVTLGSDGSFAGLPTTPGSSTAVIKVSDGGGLFDATTLSVLIGNTPPHATDDVLATKQAQAMSVSPLLNDTDVDQDVLTVSAHTNGAHGSVSCDATTCTYTPVSDFAGQDSFGYTASDGHGHIDSATVAVTVNDVAPTVVDDSAQTPRGTAVTVPVLANDSDFDPIHVSASTSGVLGNVTCTASDCTYTPKGATAGSDSFTYTVMDSYGLSKVGNVSVVILATNRPPTFTASLVNTAQTVAVGGTPAALDVVDLDADPLQFTVAGGTLPPGISLQADGTFAGTATTWGHYASTIRVSDGRGGTATTALVIDVPNRPVNVVDDAISVASGKSVTFTPLANDSDPDGDPLSLGSVSTPAHGKLSCTGASCVYTANAAYMGSDSLTYIVSDGQGHSAAGSVAVTITNSAPVLVKDSGATWSAASTVVNVLANDTDPDGDALTVIGHGAAAHGTVSCSATACRYTAAALYAGTDRFTYTVADAAGNKRSNTVTVTVTLNHVPVPHPDAAKTVGTRAVTTYVLANDVDADGDVLRIVSHTTPAHGTVTCTSTTCTYTAPRGWYGTTSYIYTVSDRHGHTARATVTVTVSRS